MMGGQAQTVTLGDLGRLAWVLELQGEDAGNPVGGESSVDMGAPAVAAAAEAEVDIPGDDEAHPVVDGLAEPAELAGDLEILPDKKIDLVCSVRSRGWQVQRYPGGMTPDFDATEAPLFGLSIGPMAAVVDEGYSANCPYDPAEVHPTEVRHLQG